MMRLTGRRRSAGYWLSAMVLALALPAGAAQNEMLQPNDFGWGAELQISGNQPFYRVTLPPDVYQNSAWPDLRDLRVFDQQGNSMPFALQQIETTEETQQDVELQLFPLRSSQMVAENQQPAAEEQRILLRSTTGVEIQMVRPASSQAGISYLIELKGDKSPAVGLSKLVLNWPQRGENWQARATLYASNDLKFWSPLLRKVPLMDLSADGNRMLLNHLDIAEGYPARYWLLTLDGEEGSALPSITRVVGSVQLRHTQVEQVTVGFETTTISPTETLYQLARPQPLSQLSILPRQSNTVLPLKVEYRSDADHSWSPLFETVVYQVDGPDGENASAPYELNQLLVQGIRLRAVNTPWGNSWPLVSAERLQKVLIFNAQGNSPYILAWGSRAAASVAIPQNQLLPPGMASVELLPEASIGANVKLGGSVRLTALAPGEQVALWQKGILWLLLVGAAFGLALLAFKLWKEVGAKS